MDERRRSKAYVRPKPRGRLRPGRYRRRVYSVAHVRPPAVVVLFLLSW